MRVDVAEIRRWHIARGFKDIGYAYVILTDGKVQQGRSVHVTGAHVQGANEGNIGICLNGRGQYSAEQFDALRLLLEQLCEQFDIGTDQIFGHYEFASAKKQGKKCPMIDMELLRRWFVSHDPTHETLSRYLLEDTSAQSQELSDMLHKKEALGGVH